MAASNLSELDYISEEVDLRIVIGQLVEFNISVVDLAGAVVDITGRTYNAYVGPDGGTAIASFVQVANDPTNGLVTMRLTALTTGALTAGSYKWIVWEDDVPLWQGDAEITSPPVTP